MDTKDQLARLYELQQTDTGIATREKALREFDDGSAAKAQLAKAKKKLAAQEGELKGREGGLVAKELRLESAEQEREAKTKQAYGGAISDPKQLSALEKKIAELGRLKDKLEEEILELMEQVELAQAEVEQQQAHVAELDKQAKETKRRYAVGTKRLSGELDDLKQAREGLVAEIDASLLKQYDALLAKCAGLAVAAVREGSCTGCKVSLPSMYAPHLRSGDRIVKCENCRRILFLPEGASAFTAEEDN